MDAQRHVDRALAEAVEEMNRQLPADRPLGTDPEVVLAGEGGVLDSLGLLGFLVAVEQRIEAQCDVQLGLVGADLTGDEGPLASMGTFSRYLIARLEAG